MLKAERDRLREIVKMREKAVGCEESRGGNNSIVSISGKEGQ